MGRARDQLKDQEWRRLYWQVAGQPGDGAGVLCAAGAPGVEAD